MEIYYIKDLYDFYHLGEENGLTMMGYGQLANRLLHNHPEITGLFKNIIVSKSAGRGILSASDNTVPRERWVVVVANTENIVAMLNTLEDNSYQRVAVLSTKFIQSVFWSMPKEFFSYRPRRLLRYEVHLAEHCNLNCRGCNNFAPIAEPEFLRIDEYKRDVTRLSELFDHEMEFVHLMGGEPLLHPDIIDFMRETRSAFPCGRIMIVTNGILLPKMNDGFWDACREYKVEISPTKYPIAVPYDAMKEKAKSKGVKWSYYSGGNEMKTLDQYPMDLSGNQCVEANWWRCWWKNTCLSLVHGVMYPCTFAAFGYHFIRRFNLPQVRISIRDGVDIYKVSTGEEMMRKLSKPIPFCRYCRANDPITGLPFVTSKREISEWL